MIVPLLTLTTRGIAWDRNSKIRDDLSRLYPDRPTWIVEGPSLTGRGFGVVAGPIPPTPCE